MNIDPADLARAQRAEQIRLHGRALGVLPLASGTVGVALVYWLWPLPSTGVLLGWMGLLACTIALRFAVHWSIRARVAQDPAHPRWRSLHRAAIGLNGLAWAMLLPVMEQLPDGPAHHAILFAVAAVLTGSVVANSFDLMATALFAVPVAVPGVVHLAEHAGKLRWQDWGLLLLFCAVVLMAAMRGRRGFMDYVRRNLQADAAALQSRADVARLERIGALAHIGPWELDAATGVLSCPPQTALALGVEPARLHTADSLAACLTPASAHALHTALEHALREGQALRVEAEVLHEGGQRRALLFVGQAVMEAGQVRRIEGAVQDVTEWQKMDRALADQARLREQLLQNTEQGIWFLDNEGLTSEVNGAMCRLLGCSREEVMGRQVFDFFSGADRATLDHQLELRRRGHKEGYEIGITRPDGSRVECFNNATPLYDAAGRKVGSVGMWTDLTPIKRAQALLEQREQELRALLGSFPGFIAAIDNTHRYRFVNEPTARRLSGAGVQDVVGRSIEDFLSPRDLEGMRRDIQERMAAPGEPWTFERTYDNAHGLGPITVQVIQVAGPRAASGEQTFYTFGIDVSERRRAQDALVAAKEEAERASRAKSQFLSQMSHELRTPLNAILGFGQLLVTDTQWPLNAVQQLKVQEILAGAEHLLNLINGLLDLSRIEAGRFTVELEPIVLEGLVGEALSLMQALAQRHQVFIPATWAAESPGLAVKADRTRLMQVLLNLIGNAVKYNRQGGRVTLECRETEGHVWLGVRDEGPGLSDEDQCRLFEPFQRLGAEGSNIEGTGIGLALSRRLVQAMGGQIGVDSAPDVGSTFWVQLPACPAHEVPASLKANDAPASAAEAGASAELHPVQDPAEAAAPASAGAHEALTVLCIEDNPVNVMVMEAMVTRLPGLRMISAEDGAPGLEMARQERPHLILTDIQMPGMDGFELMARLRQDARTQGIPVIAISADALPQTLERGREAGFAAYLTKPVQMGALHAAIREALAGRPEAAHRPGSETPGADGGPTPS